MTDAVHPEKHLECWRCPVCSADLKKPRSCPECGTEVEPSIKEVDCIRAYITWTAVHFSEDAAGCAACADTLYALAADQRAHDRPLGLAIDHDCGVCHGALRCFAFDLEAKIKRLEELE